MRGGTGDVVGLMLDAMGKAPLLRRNETIELFRVYNAGRSEDATRAQQRASARARDRIYRCNLRLAVHVARGYTRRIQRVIALDFEDLIQESAIGLNRAIEMYSIERGFEFSTYATWWCRQSVIRLIAQQATTIRVPNHVREVFNKLRSAPPDATLAEAAAFAKCTVEQAEHAIRSMQLATPASLDARLQDGDGDALVDLVAAPSDETNPDAWLLEELTAAIERLKDLDPDLMALHELRVEGARIADLRAAGLLEGLQDVQRRRRLELLLQSPEAAVARAVLAER